MYLHTVYKQHGAQWCCNIHKVDMYSWCEREWEKGEKARAKRENILRETLMRLFAIKILFANVWVRAGAGKKREQDKEVNC